MPLIIPDTATLISGHRNDFQFALKTGITTVVLGSMFAAFLFTATVIRGFPIADWPFFAILALAISLVYSIPVFILFYIAVRIVNVQNLTILQKKGLLSLIGISAFLPLCLHYLAKDHWTTKASVASGYALVLIAACFFFPLKPVKQAADKQ